MLPRFTEGSLDVVVSSMVVEHLYDPFQVIRDIAARLKPGGQFLFSTVVRDGLDARMYGPYWAGFDLPRHMVHFRKRDLLETLAPHFDRVEVFHQSAPVDFVRAATWRGKPVDRAVRAIAGSSVGKPLSTWLAWLGQTSRVSFRCRRNG